MIRMKVADQNDVERRQFLRPQTRAHKSRKAAQMTREPRVRQNVQAAHTDEKRGRSKEQNLKLIHVLPSARRTPRIVVDDRCGQADPRRRATLRREESFFRSRSPTLIQGRDPDNRRRRLHSVPNAAGRKISAAAAPPERQ
jgi:transcriptional regulator of acetoin/glycerol metabolism